jgi:hippurate hydrolase
LKSATKFSRAELHRLADLRRDLHAHPELCFEEHRTSEVIAKTLTDWALPVHRGLGKTGVVATVKSGNSSRAIGLRADMDALPITEQNAFNHASRYPGRMHACGHDGHTAMLLAAAKYLAEHRNFDGTVYLIFQPAEEGGGGAHEMIKDGLFELFPMDAVFGIHNWPGLAVGQFAIKSGPIFASANKFKITIRGTAAHAAMPHNSIDPVLIACHLVQAFQSILTRNKRPIDGAVLAVTMIHAGETISAVPDRCEIQGVVRTFKLDVLDMIERRMREIAVSICDAFGGACVFDFDRYYPSTINHDEETRFAHSVLQGLVGAENVLECEPAMTAEDFSFFLQAKPGCYFLIGNGDGQHNPSSSDGPCVLHNPHYDFNDDLIPLGGSMWVRLVESWFRRRSHIA